MQSESLLHSLLVDTEKLPRTGSVLRFHSDLDRLIAPEATPEVLAMGFVWTEGPVWVKAENCLLFSDIPRNSIFRWRPGRGVDLYLKPSGYTGVEPYGKEPGSNGLTLDSSGRLVACEHGDRRVSVLTRGGGKRTLCDHYEGKRLNSPNDCVFDSRGALYFSDPPYGLPENYADPLREIDFCGVYRWTEADGLRLLTAELSRPNGLAFSPDERTLYVSNSDPERAIWMAYPINENSELGIGRVFADVTSSVGKHPGLPDGLKLDDKGNLFATGPGGVWIWNAEGELLGRIDTGQATANVAWGEDGHSLFLCADMYLMRIRTLTKGSIL